MYQALYRKWRPRTFDDVVGQSHITETLKRQVQEGRLSHAYLFTGTRGTGKTSCAKILSRAVNCEHPVNGNPCNECAACRGIESGAILDVLELDAASNNGVDQVRALRDEAVYSPAAVRKRVYIVDEVHMLSTQAFNALLKILEEPPEHLMFILATTELHKVLPTIRSRCQQFAFKRLSPLDITQRLKYVAGEEGIPLTSEGAALIARLADGGMRDALSLLDQCAAGERETLGEQEILTSLGLAGNVETAALMEEIARRDTGAALERMDRLYAAGKDVGSLLNELSSLTRDLLIRKTAPRGGAGLLNGGYDAATLRGLDEGFTAPRLSQILGKLQSVGADLGRSANRRVDAELCLIRLCDETLDDSPVGLNARLARMEEQLAAGMPVARVSKDTSVPTEAPEDADMPPWDMEPPLLPEGTVKLGEGSQIFSEVYQAETKTSEPVEAEQPTREETSRVGAFVVSDFWPELVSALKGKVPMGEYSFLSNPAMVKGSKEDSVLTVWAQSDFVKDMIDKPGVMALVEKVVSDLSGETCRVIVKVGVPPMPAEATESEKHDKLDDLLALGQQFGDIITEE